MKRENDVYSTLVEHVSHYGGSVSFESVTDDQKPDHWTYKIIAKFDDGRSFSEEGPSLDIAAYRLLIRLPALQ